MDGMRKTRNIKHGSMAQHFQGTTVIITDTTSFFEISGGYSEESVLGFVFQNGKELKCEEPAMYAMFWNISARLAMNNNQNFVGGVMLNGAIQTLTTAHGRIGAGNDLQNIAGRGVFTIANGDLISLGLRNIDAINNFDLEHAAITLLKLVD